MKFGLAQHIIDNLITVFEQHPKVDKALVFGSRAKGNYRPDSDIDIAIKGQDLNTDDIIAMSVAFEEKGITHKIDLINYQSIQEPDLKDHIDRVGVEFYSRWKEVKLGEVVEINNKSIGKDYVHKEIQYLDTGSITQNKIDGYQYFNIKDAPSRAKRLVKQKDIIYSTVRPIQRHYGFIENHNDNLVVSTGFAVISTKENADAKYLYYLLSSDDIVNFLDSIADGSTSTYPSLRPDDLAVLDISLPPLPEQTAIANTLSSLDDKIDLLHRQNKTLEQLAETLFRQWFVEEAEESWEVVTVGQFVKTNLRSISKNYPFSEIEYLDTSSLTKGIINETQTLYLKDAPSRAKRLVQNNDILISTVRPDQKHYGITHNPKKNLVVSTGFCVISCTEINPYFVYLLLTSDEMTQYLHSIAEGSTSTYPSLKPSDIEKIEFQKPPENKLNEFGNLACDYWTKINNNQTQIRTLTQTRDTLLPKLMSGEVKVKMN